MVPLTKAAARYAPGGSARPRRPGCWRSATPSAYDRPGLWGDDGRTPKSVILVREGNGQLKAFGAGESNRPSPGCSGRTESSRCTPLSRGTSRSPTTSGRSTAPSSRPGPTATRASDPSETPDDDPRPLPKVAAWRLNPSHKGAFEAFVPPWGLRVGHVRHDDRPRLVGLRRVRRQRADRGGVGVRPGRQLRLDGRVHAPAVPPPRPGLRGGHQRDLAAQHRRRRRSGRPRAGTSRRSPSPPNSGSPTRPARRSCMAPRPPRRALRSRARPRHRLIFSRGSRHARTPIERNRRLDAELEAGVSSDAVRLVGKRGGR